MSRAVTFLAGAVTGAAAAYFLDPQGGARRRAETRDKTVSSVKTNVSSAATQATAKRRRSGRGARCRARSADRSAQARSSTPGKRAALRR